MTIPEIPLKEVFLISSQEHRRFAPLLEALLRFHSLHVRILSAQEPEELDFAGSISETESASPFLLTLYSRSACDAASLDEVISQFQTTCPQGQIIPLSLDENTDDSIPKGLETLSSAAFQLDLLKGFQELWRLMGLEFLPLQPAPPLKDRSRERRAKSERRQADLSQRMRLGFWFAYARATGVGKFDLLPVRVSTLYRTIDALSGEVANYQYLDENNQKVPCRDALEKAVNSVWQEIRGEDDIKAVILVEAIAERLTQRFQVRLTERRYEQDRRDGL